MLGVLNFSLFWWLLFVATYRLPGGVAATITALQPLIVIFLARFWLSDPIRAGTVLAALTGLSGAALLVLTPAAALDPAGIAAAFGAAVSMACGTVLTRKWQPPVSLMTFTAWQLTAGGLLLVPLVILFEPAIPSVTAKNLTGLVWIGLIGAALTYLLWFRGISRLGPATASLTGFLSPLTAVLLGAIVLGQIPNLIQSAGIVLVLFSVWLGARVNRPEAG